MVEGVFLPEDTDGDGPKIYRLSWNAKEKTLDPEEISHCLFTRYLIALGKLGEQ